MLEWDEGNLSKLELVRQSGRVFYQDEIESIFNDANQLITLTYSDPKTGEERYMIRGISNQNRVVSVIFVVRQPGDRIRVLNVWKTKGSKLKEYNEQQN
jgi:uncharacterized DUF497 family protein